MNCIGFIPVRGGSKRLPGKNLMLFGGMTLLERTIRQAQEVFDESRVCTEDAALSVESLRCKMPVSWRPQRLAADDAKTEDVIEYWLSQYREHKWFCLLQVTSPLRTVEDIRTCVELAEHEDRPVVSVHNGKRNGAVYVARTWPPKHDYFHDALYYEMPRERSIDIDTLEDLQEAERILNDTVR